MKKSIKKLSIIFFTLSILSTICFLFLNANFIFLSFFLFCVSFVLSVISLAKMKRGGVFYRTIGKVVLSISCVVFIVLSSILAFKTDYKKAEFVIHAGGSLGNKYYLNCVEGVQHYIEQNCKLIELDFVFTSDNEIICSHVFEYFKNFSFKNRPTLEQALNTSILGEYSTLTFNNLIQILKENPDVKIVFDTKEENYTKLVSLMLEKSESESFDLKKQMIIQVYSYANYLEMLDFNFDEYWFTNYKAIYTPNQIKKYFSNCEKVTTIVLYDFYWKLFRSVNFSINKKIAVHTVNDKSLINFMQNRGVDYIYCDYI